MPHEEGDSSCGLAHCQVLEITGDSTSWFLNLNPSQTWAKSRLPGRQTAHLAFPLFNKRPTYWPGLGPLWGLFASLILPSLNVPPLSPFPGV